MKCSCRPYFTEIEKINKHFSSGQCRSVYLGKKPVDEDAPVFLYPSPSKPLSAPFAGNMCLVFDSIDNWNDIKPTISSVEEYHNETVTFATASETDAATRFVVWVTRVDTKNAADLGSIFQNAQRVIPPELASVPLICWERLSRQSKFRADVPASRQYKRATKLEIKQAAIAVFGVKSDCGERVQVQCPNPQHEDKNPSATLFFKIGNVYCHVCRKSYSFNSWRSGDLKNVVGRKVSAKRASTFATPTVAAGQTLLDRWFKQ